MMKIITQDDLKYLIKRDVKSCDVIEKILKTNDDAEERRALLGRLTELFNEMFAIANLLIAMEDLGIRMIVIEEG